MSAVKWSVALVFASLVAVGCAATPLPEEELAESENALRAGPTVTPSEVAAHLRNAGWEENMIGKMVCVAKWESTFFTRARNGRHHGLFQISTLHLGTMPSCPSTVEALYNPATNARCALAIYKRQGIRAWTAYGHHRAECSVARAPTSANVSTGPDDDDTSTTPDTGDDAETSVTSGSCWSGTNQNNVVAGGCVQSGAASARGVWMQCNDGKWYRGGDAESGPFGECQGSKALQ